MNSRRRVNSTVGRRNAQHNRLSVMTDSNITAKFESLRASGHSAKDVTVVAIADGLDFGQTIQMLHRVFKLDFADAKEAWLQAKGIASSLDEYQRDLVPVVDVALPVLKKHFD